MYKILIVEDENSSAQFLSDILINIDPENIILGILPSIKETVKWLEGNKADLIFMDVELSDGLCFNIFEETKITTPIIFTTAYNKFAIKAFEFNSIAYLLKPVSKENIEYYLAKLDSLRSFYNVDIVNFLTSLKQEDTKYRKRFLIQYADKLVTVETDDIAFFYILDNNVFFKTFNGECYPLELSLNNLEAMLNPEKFFRINRKYIINCNAIRSMKSWSRNRVKKHLVGLPDETDDTIVSMYNTSAFKKWLNS
jgi:DNA-binding LytR/AlgR family response regulator